MQTPQDIAPLIPAATVILLRDGSDGLEALMLRRNKSLRSFGGAWVFPGGKVDQNDAPNGSDLLRAQTASCRETYEETGLTIQVSDLVSLSHWIPPIQERRRFSTRFFVAQSPNAKVKIDDGEIHDYKWVSPKRVITDAPDPELIIMPPTYVSLHDLSAFNGVEDALAGINGRPDELFETRFARTGTGFVTYWQSDAAYESGDLELAGPRRRLVTAADKWQYQRENL